MKSKSVFFFDEKKDTINVFFILLAVKEREILSYGLLVSIDKKNISAMNGC